MKKILFIILDGLGDRPVSTLGNQTPLEAAKTPNFDFLAQSGLAGLLNPLPPDEYPTSEEGHLSIFGYDLKKEFPGRGPLEALGIGVKLKPGEVAIRVDFGTVDPNWVVIDARAGRIEDVSGLCKAISNITIQGVTFNVYPGLQHRGVLVLSGKGISSKISDVDPHKTGPHRLGVKILWERPLDKTLESFFTARILQEYYLAAHEILKKHPLNQERILKNLLPANVLLARGAGEFQKVETFDKRWNVKSACIAGAPLYKGIACFLGMDVVEVAGANGLASTNLLGKFKKAADALSSNSKYDFLFLHIKAVDVFGEDGDCKGKKEFLEKIDIALGKIIPKITHGNIITTVCGDHATPCTLKDHSADPVPVLIYDGQDRDKTENFGESFCKKGSLGHLQGKEFLKKVLKI